jgi:hypothetical protein
MTSPCALRFNKQVHTGREGFRLTLELRPVPGTFTSRPARAYAEAARTSRRWMACPTVLLGLRPRRQPLMTRPFGSQSA